MRRRRGFTLIEVLVVIAVISVLATMTAFAVFAVLGNARTQATKSLIARIDSLLQQRLEAFNQQKRDPVLSQAYFGRFSLPQRTADVLGRKVEFRWRFPQTWAELAAVPRLMTQSGETAPATVNAATESSEVLYFLLTKANVTGFQPAGTDAFSASEARDTDGNGKIEFVDAWGNPLRFYRWPTRLIRPGGYGSTPTAAQIETARVLMPTLPSTAAELGRDPDDPLGLVDAWLTNPQAAQFENGTSMFSAFITSGQPWFHTVATYHSPLLVSAGPDGAFGLLGQNAFATFGHLAAPDTSAAGAAALLDNLTNYNIRSGGN